MKRVRSQIVRRNVDISLLNINVIGGFVHLTGVLAKMRTHPEVDLQSEMETISQILRQMSGIRDVVWNVSLRT